MQDNFNERLNPDPTIHADQRLRQVVDRLTRNIQRDDLVQRTTYDLRNLLQVDRVVLYYFYRQWKGQVTFESVGDERLSIFGATGPDECFNGEYAALYQAGRFRAIADIEVEPIQPCHREFLKTMQVRANLVVPVLTQRGLWGLLVAHHCRAPHLWSESDIQAMQSSAKMLAQSAAIRDF